MKTKRIKSILIAAVIAFESVVMGWVPATAQTVSVSENAVAEQEVADVAENVTEESAVNEGKETSTNSENITAETVSDSGIDGDLTWTLDANGHLTITGTGNYADRANIQTEGWLAHASKIKSATVNVTGITDTSYMFYNCTNLESVVFEEFDTSSVRFMQCMFSGCSSLESLDLSEFKTDSAGNMRHMFYECRSLEVLLELQMH